MTPHDTFDFIYNDTTNTYNYTLSLHDALPIWSEQNKFDGTIFAIPMNMKKKIISVSILSAVFLSAFTLLSGLPWKVKEADRKSTRLNSSHTVISYAVFCLKKKKKNIIKAS